MSFSYFSTDFVEKLSFPRFAGTEGEEKAQKLIETELKKLNVKFKKEQFDYSTFYMNVLLRIYDPLIGTLIITMILLVYFQLFLVVLLLSLLLFVFSLFSRQIRERIQFKCNKFGKKGKSSNYIVDLPAKEPNDNNQNIIIFAHYDSISHGLNPILAGAIFFLSLGGGVLFSFHVFIVTALILIGFISSIDLIGFIYGFLLAGIYSIQLLNTRHNKSDGTIDNATGVANAFYLIDFFKGKPLQKTNLIIVLTGAEEVGDQGAYHFIKTNSNSLSKENSYFFIIDSVGGNKDKNLYFSSQGLPKKRYSPLVEQEILHLLKHNKEKYPIESMYIPPLIHYSTDHAPLKPYGYQFMIFGSNGVIHSDKDNLDNYYPEMLENFNEFSKELIIRMDDIKK